MVTPVNFIRELFIASAEEDLVKNSNVRMTINNNRHHVSEVLFDETSNSFTVFFDGDFKLSCKEFLSNLSLIQSNQDIKDGSVCMIFNNKGSTLKAQLKAVTSNGVNVELVAGDTSSIESVNIEKERVMAFMSIKQAVLIKSINDSRLLKIKEESETIQVENVDPSRAKRQERMAQRKYRVDQKKNKPKGLFAFFK